MVHTAETIKGAILQYLHNNLQNCVLLVVIRAAVATGIVTGVATRLSNRCPKMVAVHCANHRLALAAAHASDSIPYLKKYMHLVSLTLLISLKVDKKLKAMVKKKLTILVEMFNEGAWKLMSILVNGKVSRG